MPGDEGGARPSDGTSALAGALRRTYGPRKRMAEAVPSLARVRYFLLRRFLGDIDLLTILNSKRCRYRCRFCGLGQRAATRMPTREEVQAQYLGVLMEVRHALSLVDRLTISNDGSVFDKETLPPESLEDLMSCVRELTSVRRVVFESLLQFVAEAQLEALRGAARGVTVDILTGFETVDRRIRSTVLGKPETLEQFEEGLDRIAGARCSLTAYVMYKPDPVMSDHEARDEALATIRYLERECGRREVPLTIRVNPAYAASGTEWDEEALSRGGFRAPRLTDVLVVAEECRRNGTPIYIGLSTEDLALPGGSYAAREDFTPGLLEKAKQFNYSGRC